MQHVDEGQLHAYLDGELTEPGEDPREVERHLAECAECRATMDGVRLLRERGRALLVDPLPVEQPPFDAVIARARRPAPRPAASPRRAARLAWAASLVVALGAGWLARDLLRQEPAPGMEMAASMEDSSAPTPQAAAAPAQQDAAVAPVQSEESAPVATAAAPAAPAATNAAGRAGQAPGEGEVGGTLALNQPAPPPTVEVEGVVALGYGTQRREIAGGPAAADQTGVATAPPPPPPPTVAAPGAPEPAAAAAAARPVAARSARVMAAPFGDPGGWATVDRGTAEQRLGAPLALVPGLPVLGYELSVGAEGPAVRVRQRLPGGEVLTLLAQRAAGTARESTRSRAPASEQTAGPSPGQASAESEATRRVRTLFLSGRAAIPADSLAALLAKAR